MAGWLNLWEVEVPMILTLSLLGCFLWVDSGKSDERRATFREDSGAETGDTAADTGDTAEDSGDSGA